MVISSAGRARNADILVKAFKMMERDPNVAAEEEIFLVALNSCSLAEVIITNTPSQYILCIHLSNPCTWTEVIDASPIDCSPIPSV